MAKDRDMSYGEALRQSWTFGLEEGTEEGIRQSILDVLKARFGNVPEDIKEKVHSARGRNVLRRLLEKAALVESLEKFEV